MEPRRADRAARILYQVHAHVKKSHPCQQTNFTSKASPREQLEALSPEERNESVWASISEETFKPHSV